jgi:hypothetical protein
VATGGNNGGTSIALSTQERDKGHGGLRFVAQKFGWDIVLVEAYDPADSEP